MDTSKSVVVLLVEDDPGDQKLIGNALAHQEIKNRLYIVGNGEEALQYLERSKTGDTESPWPDLILLDLNMPGMGGKECLRCIKADSDLCAIPVVVVTTSDSESDVQESYRLHAAGYVQKSPSPEELQRIVKKLAKYWFATSLLVKN